MKFCDATRLRDARKFYVVYGVCKWSPESLLVRTFSKNGDLNHCEHSTIAFSSTTIHYGTSSSSSLLLV